MEKGRKYNHLHQKCELIIFDYVVNKPYVLDSNKFCIPEEYILGHIFIHLGSKRDSSESLLNYLIFNTSVHRASPFTEII